ncbi:DUF4817 domain-containing protein [Trichonephila clavipes]|uniref:DUF4817 domain-containing protein n=1 Tax=Trichonephila clavipes TaxID=2585209 RepID=A0A8X6RS53_TRICX|nr:DUF4817 domain-containing protein [Trichonephila clavipes]
MLSAPDKALLLNLFYMNEESAIIALRKCRVQKNVNSGKGPLTSAGLLKLVKSFEETGKLEDRARAGRPCLKVARAPSIAVEMEAIAFEAASGTTSAREAARRLGLPPSSVHNILRRILQLYPYKLQSCHELLSADTAQREAFAKWAFSKMEQDPTWVFNIMWTEKIARFNVNNHDCFGRPQLSTHLHSPKVTAWCGFTGSFIIGPFFFETQCPVNGWITEVSALSNASAGDCRAMFNSTRYPWPPRRFNTGRLYLKSRVYLSGLSSLSELKDAIRREVSSIHPDMLHSAVAGFVTRLECLLPCGVSHVEHILV